MRAVSLNRPPAINLLLSVLFCWLNLLLVSTVLAKEATPENEEMSELMNILEEETSIATKTKINSDFVPGMVTVLHGDDMQALGKLNVWQALSLVPGLKTLKTDSGTPLVIARSSPFPFNNGNLKIMLNSTTMSSEVSGINSYVLLIPIEQVERIEVIRGPGSSIYGNSAFMGLINIITRKENRQLSINSLDGRISSVGGQYYWQDPERDLHISTNLSIEKNTQAISPVNTEADDEQTSLIVAVDYEQTSITAQLFERNNLLYGLRRDTVEVDEQTISLALNQKIKFSNNWDSNILLSYRENDFEENKIYQGSVTRAQMDFNGNIFEKHQLLISLAFEHYDLEQATLCIDSNIPLAGQPGFIPGVTPHPPANSCSAGFNTNNLLQDEQWQNYSLSVQDQLLITENLTLTAGVGLHRNTNIDESNITPRLAVVWKLTEHHLLKAQYSKGFRSPTYFETYDVFAEKNDLQSEQAETYELGYIYKKNNQLARVTFFQSKLDNFIYPENRPSTGGISIRRYQNSAHGQTKGIEFEWEQKLNEYFKWAFNLTYSDFEDNRGIADGHSQPSAGASEWLANLSLYYQPKENVLITSHYYYVGDQVVTNGEIDGYNKLDLTINLFQFLHKKITLRAGVKNLLDESIFYFDTKPSTTEAVEYPGRSWWAQLSYNF